MTEEKDCRIRFARREDLPRIMDIYAYAREFMIKNGNPNQWTGGWPWQEVIENDIEKITKSKNTNDMQMETFLRNLEKRRYNILSEIKIANLPMGTQDYLLIAKSYYLLGDLKCANEALFHVPAAKSWALGAKINFSLGLYTNSAKARPIIPNINENIKHTLPFIFNISFV